MTDTIKAELVYYRIDTSRPGGCKAYEELCETLKEIPFETRVSKGVFPNGTTNFQLHKFIDSLREKLDIRIYISSVGYQFHSREVNLETEHLFKDQWNAAEGLRLFNKAAFEWPNLHIKEGYYIRQNPEMIAVLQSTAKCGYCGHQAPVGEKDFCDKCLSSPHLGVADLHLLRMEPIEAPEWRSGGVKSSQRAPLTQEELAVIMPRYTEAQTKLRKHQEAEVRADVEAEFDNSVELATIKRDGMLWILDAGISTENLIFYLHNRTFTFGWRNPVSKEVKTKLAERLKRFPFKFEIKGEE